MHSISAVTKFLDDNLFSYKQNEYALYYNITLDIFWLFWNLRSLLSSWNALWKINESDYSRMISSTYNVLLQPTTNAHYFESKHVNYHDVWLMKINILKNSWTLKSCLRPTKDCTQTSTFSTFGPIFYSIKELKMEIILGSSTFHCHII